jgi:hypothetical protein
MLSGLQAVALHGVAYQNWRLWLSTTSVNSQLLWLLILKYLFLVKTNITKKEYTSFMMELITIWLVKDHNDVFLIQKMKKFIKEF